MAFKTGERLLHRHNRELGPGVVRAVEERTLVVAFPSAGVELRLASDSDAIAPLVFGAGDHARLGPEGDEVIVAARDGDRIRLTDGRVVSHEQLWPPGADSSLVDRLARGQIDPIAEFANRIDALHLNMIREADGLGSFLGGRIHLFPHQLFVAEQATRKDPVRWLLADEVGLGKTVEACLVLNRLARTGRADRTMIVAPETLTVQWLGELWRKYHQVFVMLDDRRLADVEREYGKEFNPFEAHWNTVVSFEMLVAEPWLGRRAVEAGIDLLIVDEAHHLRRPPKHPGNPEYRVIRPIADLGRHVLLLTGTPLEDDTHGFFRLLQILRPDEFPEDVDFDRRLASGQPIPPCASSTRRSDIGGLPPRRPVPADLAADDAWREHHELENVIRGLAASDAAQKKRASMLLRRFLSSVPALLSSLTRADGPLRKRCRALTSVDPRLRWLADRAPAWKAAGDKTLVFVAHRDSLEMIRTGLSRLAQVRAGVFHEDLSPAQRDIEVAQFRLDSGPSILVSTECGGEGRNFEFCTRMVLFDLPWDPMVVEQRIGRLDRIGRTQPVEIRYFRPPEGVQRSVAALFEELGLFEVPLGGLELELAPVEPLIESRAVGSTEPIDGADFSAVVVKTRRAYSVAEEAAYHRLLRDRFRADMGERLLARVPPELESLTEDVVLAACELLHIDAQAERGQQRYSIHLGSRSLVESLPGVPAGSSFLGTFDREQAVADESIDFFAAGHPLVEGVLAHLEDTDAGRVGLLRLRGHGVEGLGLLGLFRQGSRFEARAVDLAGNLRPDWAALASRRPVRSKRSRPEAWFRQTGWPDLVRRLAERLDGPGELVALAAFSLEP